MPSVTTVKHARKAYPESDIKRGDEYYWWKFPYGSKIRSKTYPKPQQLTQSDFMIQVYDLQERVEKLLGDMKEDELTDEVESIVEDIRNLGQEQEEKKDNMPEGLQESGTGELLGNRAESCEGWADDLEGVLIEKDDGDPDQGFEDTVKELQNQEYTGE